MLRNMEKSDPPTTPNYHIVFYSSNRTFCQPNTVRASFRSSLDKERMLDCGTQTHDFLGMARDACTAGMVMQNTVAIALWEALECHM